MTQNDDVSLSELSRARARAPDIVPMVTTPATVALDDMPLDARPVTAPATFASDDMSLAAQIDRMIDDSAELTAMLELL